MRRLRTVVLENFKTFSGSHVVEVGDGMTAIVGPNGCGKSNLIDAVAWAVGSRSWKSLRGEGMDDVVFHGTDGVPAAESARVRLVFENGDRALGLDAEEVEVARDLVREGESRAWLNGTEARVRDLQQALASTGLVGGFAVVRQGTVDQLILGSREDLGRWIEDAAGISKYRSQKREALARLDKVGIHLAEAETRRNRLRDERKKLAKQVEGANAKREIETRLETARHLLAAAERKKLSDEIARYRRNLNVLDRNDLQLVAERDAFVRRRDEAQNALAPLQANEAVLIPTQDELREKAALLRIAAGALRELAFELERSGPAAWPTARENLRSVIADLQEVAAIQRAAPDAESVKILRDMNAAIDTSDRERAAIAKKVAELQLQIARADERLAMLPPVPEGTDAGGLPAALRREVVDLERTLAKIGPVDETAALRDAEIEREIEAVKDVLEDLRETRGTLFRFVDQIDSCAAIVFRDTLRTVGARFQSYFETLFGGGRARLRMTKAKAEDSEEEEAEEPLPDLSDELKSPPVEIRARLPGKSECPLSLLSGGERSLTGVALVLALAAQNPDGEGEGGRLLILDEVDAALDDANTVRFARLLGELARQHQILAVTHNRLTCREAVRLLGVTTGDAPGTSRIVQVELPADVDLGMKEAPALRQG